MRDLLGDGLEFDLVRSKNAAWTLSHDFDGDGNTDLNDRDADNDSLDDAFENWNRNATIEANETDPYNNDTDGDGLLDGAEPKPFIDTDGDGNINGRDTNSNGDSLTDDQQVWVAFRTNATGGNYGGAGVWVALITPRMNPAMPQYINYDPSIALFTWVETVAAPNGSQVLDPYGVDNTSTDVVNLTTPEGYLVLWHQNGSSIDIYIQVSAAKTEKFVKGGMVPSDYSTSNRSVELFLNRDQEVYDGRAALSSDTDFDGINNTRETACGTNPNDNDSDDDGILDGIERGWCEDSPLDGDATINALDIDSDGDGILDGVEDANKNGFVDIGETDGLDADSDDDGIADGDEDHNRNGIRDVSGGAFNESSPLDRDSDDDGVLDGTEDTNHNGLYASGDDVSSLILVDTDGDGLWDGQELGVSAPGADTDMTKFRRDLDPDPLKNTLPKDNDTDDDGILDGTEDLDRNGRVDSGEANPSLWDTDGDGLCDGNCSGKGEDFNLNGIRDQDASGNWTETDFLANDSDVDGIHDGAEVNGSWCFKGEIANCGSINTTRALLPLNPDTDGDGLRDGQETSGWMVGIWFERTMEKYSNFSVTSDPWAGRADSDGDLVTDFDEFMNGSDPRALDTDTDGINDTAEIHRHSNLTGIEGTPPVISNVTWSLSKWIEVGWGYLAIHVTVSVDFDLDDNVGIQTILVSFTRLGSATERTSWTPGGALHMRPHSEFQFSLAEALLSGGDINITAFDTNGNGAWGQFHLKSVFEAVAETVVAFFNLSAIAKVIVEAASAMAEWVLSAIESLLTTAARPITDMVAGWVKGLGRLLENAHVSFQSTRASSSPANSTMEVVIRYILEFMLILQVIVLALTAVGILADLSASATTGGMKDVVLGILATALLVVVASAVVEVLVDTFTNFGSFYDLIESALPGGKDVLENEVAARDFVLALVAFLWEFVSHLLKRGEGKIGWGFVLVLGGLFVTGLSFAFQSTQKGQLSFFNLLFAWVGQLMASIGLAMFLVYEAPVLKDVSKLQLFVKTGVGIGGVLLARGAVVASGLSVIDCLRGNPSSC